MFVYDDSGLPVGYEHSNFECRASCINPDRHRAVEKHMLDWYRSLPGQARVRLGKVGIMQGSEPNLRRLEHE